MGCHALLQGIFPIQGSTQVSRIAGGFFTISATREAYLEALQFTASSSSGFMALNLSAQCHLLGEASWTNLNQNTAISLPHTPVLGLTCLWTS